MVRATAISTSVQWAAIRWGAGQRTCCLESNRRIFTSKLPIAPGADQKRRWRSRCREARARAERKRDSAQPQEQGEASRDDQYWARQLLGKIDRDVAKPATMTKPYGVTRGTIY